MIDYERNSIIICERSEDLVLPFNLIKHIQKIKSIINTDVQICFLEISKVKLPKLKDMIGIHISAEIMDKETQKLLCVHSSDYIDIKKISDFKYAMIFTLMEKVSELNINLYINSAKYKKNASCSKKFIFLTSDFEKITNPAIAESKLINYTFAEGTKLFSASMVAKYCVFDWCVDYYHNTEDIDKNENEESLLKKYWIETNIDNILKEVAENTSPIKMNTSKEKKKEVVKKKSLEQKIFNESLHDIKVDCESPLTDIQDQPVKLEVPNSGIKKNLMRVISKSSFNLKKMNPRVSKEENEISSYEKKKN